MSRPDDETREPDENLTPDETAEQQPVSRSAADAEAPEVEAGVPEADAGDEYAPPSEVEDFAAAPLDESGETVDFAAPAEMESGLAFQSMDSLDEGAEEPEGAADEEPMPDFGEETGEFGVDVAEGETGEEEEEQQEEDAEKPEGRGRRILAAIGRTDPYTVMMGVALLALLVGTLIFIMELSAYNFDVGAERARQVVGALGFGWLMGLM